jgi:flavin-dependent dehydrogenase
MTAPDVDIVVIGGGPAGAITALRLQRFGFRVRLIEQAKFPRSHIGEAITEGVLRQLKFLGLEHVLEKSGYLGFSTAETWWNEDQFVSSVAPPGTATIDRGAFDQALLAVAAKDGVEVRLGECVHKVIRIARGWRILVDTSAGLESTTTRYVVDASGRRSVFPRRRETTSETTIALYAYWRGSEVSTAPRVRAGRNFWCWGAPISSRGYNVTVFTDPDTLRLVRGDLQTRYFDFLARSEMIPVHKGLVLTSRVLACDATSYLDFASTGHEFIKVGEAAFGIDPLASMGIQKAIQSGIWAAIVANTVLRRPGDDITAQAFYTESLQRSATKHAAWASEIYGLNQRDQEEKFWRTRARKQIAPGSSAIFDPSTPSSADYVILSPAVKVVKTPCIVGNFIEARRAVIPRNSGNGPIAFVGHIEIAKLLDHVEAGCNLGALEKSIASQFGSPMARKLVAWLLREEILQPRVCEQSAEVGG